MFFLSIVHGVREKAKKMFVVNTENKILELLEDKMKDDSFWRTQNGEKNLSDQFLRKCDKNLEWWTSLLTPYCL